MEIVPLHLRFDLLQKCAQLLNSEWPRSLNARVFNLEKSCDKLPCSLIIIENVNGETKVVGHSQLSAIRGHNDSCLLQSGKVYLHSVLVDKEKRGQGLGKQLMLYTENYAKHLGIGTIYLTTKDKQGFYEKLGYSYCEPLNLYGSMFSIFQSKPKPKVCPRHDTISAGSIPTPPPMPNSLRKEGARDWMKKLI